MQVWQLPENTISFQFDTSGLETSDNYAQDFNNTNATQSSSTEAGREGKENKKQEWNVCKYSYGITSWFFFSCLITLS